MNHCRRGIAVVVALVALATGAGLPAADPCALHHHPAEGIQLSAASHHASCHSDDQGLPCAAMGVCLSGTAAVPVRLAGIDGAGPESGVQIFADVSFHSYTSPPLSPPPQA